MPSWSRDGREIYYMAHGGRLMAATVHRERGFVADAPRMLFEVHLRTFIGMTRNQYDVTPDQRFLVNVKADDETAAASITLIQNWRARLHQ
jgi:hypothetical protein